MFTVFCDLKCLIIFIGQCRYVPTLIGVNTHVGLITMEVSSIILFLSDVLINWLWGKLSRFDEMHF